METRVLAFLLGVTSLPAGCAVRHGHAADRRADGWRPAAAAPRVLAAATPARAPAPPVLPPASPAVPAPGDLRRRAVEQGRAILAGTAARPPRQDCSGFVMAAFARAGHPLEIPARHAKGTRSAAEMLYRWAEADGRTHAGAPGPGDLAFFRDTWGAMDGRITHVALVERVEPDGTVILLHHMGGRYRRSPMNLSVPHEPLKNGSFRKRGSANDPVLAGELFVAFARPG